MKKYYLGADVSKGYCDFILLDRDHNIVEQIFQLDDTAEGYSSLLKILKRYSSNANTIFIVGFESTGGYENRWIEAIASFCIDLKIKIARLNPTAVHASGKATLVKIKTDKSSALLIAKYLIRFEDKVKFIEGNNWYHLRQHWKYISVLKKQKVQLTNYLQGLLYNYNPSLIVYYRHPIPNWLLNVIEKYPTGHKLKNAKVKAFTRLPYINEDRAKSLKKNAKENLGLRSESAEIIIKNIIRQVKWLKAIIDEQTLLIEEYIDPESMDILTSFTGINKKSAIGLMVEIGDIDRFETDRKLTGYIGVHPVYRQSGDGTYGMHMSKQGRGQAKKILYMVTMSAIQKNNDIRLFYLKKQLQGKTKMVAIGACMNKILRIVFMMLKNKSKFLSTVDSETVKLYEDKLEKRISSDMKAHVARELKRKRIHQDFDSAAPISMTEHKKRKKYESYISKQRKDQS